MKQNLVYHQHRQLKLELENSQIAIVMNDTLKDFYSITVRQFPNLGRELEVDDGPEPLYKKH